MGVALVGAKECGWSRAGVNVGRPPGTERWMREVGFERVGMALETGRTSTGGRIAVRA
jgi:hypothetical protein